MNGNGRFAGFESQLGGFFFGSERGLSNLVTTFILILAVVVGGATAYTAYKEQWFAMESNAQLQVQSADLVSTPSSGRFSVTVKNTGSERLENVVIYIENGDLIPAWKVESKREWEHAENSDENVTENVVIADETLGLEDIKPDNDEEILILNAENLRDVGDDLDADYYLGQDIDMSDESFTPIGSKGDPFTGTFDGGMYEVENLSVGSSGANNVGLFAAVENAHVENVGIVGSGMTVEGSENVGPLAGIVDNSVLYKCYSRDGTVIGTDRVGGLVGSMVDARVSNCFARNVLEKPGG